MPKIEKSELLAELADVMPSPLRPLNVMFPKFVGHFEALFYTYGGGYKTCVVERSSNRLVKAFQKSIQGRYDITTAHCYVGRVCAPPPSFIRAVNENIFLNDIEDSKIPLLAQLCLSEELPNGVVHCDSCWTRPYLHTCWGGFQIDDLTTEKSAYLRGIRKSLAALYQSERPVPVGRPTEATLLHSSLSRNESLLLFHEDPYLGLQTAVYNTSDPGDFCPTQILFFATGGEVGVPYEILDTINSAKAQDEASKRNVLTHKETEVQASRNAAFEKAKNMIEDLKR